MVDKKNVKDMWNSLGSIAKSAIIAATITLAFCIYVAIGFISPEIATILFIFGAIWLIVYFWMKDEV